MGHASSQALLETRYLIAAVVLAEELNFTRAARRLKISQSGLSRRLFELESRYHLKLFLRDHSKVILTDAGRVFVEEAKLALLHEERAILYARAAAEGAELHVTFGHSPYVSPSLISTLLSIQLPLHPGLIVNTQSDFAPELVHGLVVSKLDLALIANPGDHSKLTMTKVMEWPFSIAMPENHPFADHDCVRLHDLQGSTWVLFDRKTHPMLHDSVLRRAHEEKLTFRGGKHILTTDEALHLVAENVGVAFLSEAGAMQHRRAGISIRPLLDSELRVELFLASRIDNKSKLVSEFARTFMKRIGRVLSPRQLTLPMAR